MATVVSFNGGSFTIPSVGEEDWGGSSKVDGFLIAVANNALAKSGGTFILTAELDFGGLFGQKCLYYKSRGMNVATDGIVRLANTEGVAWRNAANDQNLVLKVNAANQLEFNGNPIMGTSGFVTIDRATIANGSNDHVLINSNTGALSSEAQLAKSRGGCGADMSSVTFPSSGTLVTTAATQTLSNKAIQRRVVSLVDAATITIDGSLGDIYRVTLAGDRTLANPANIVDGQMIQVHVKQDGAGNRKLSYGAAFRFSTDLPQPTLSTLPGAMDRLLFECNGANLDLIAVNKGYL